MKIVLKLQTPSHIPALYFSAKTDSGVTTSLQKATSVNIVKIWKNQPELLQHFRLCMVKNNQPIPLSSIVEN